MSQQFQSGPGQSQRIPSEQLVFNLCWNPGAVHPSTSERRPSNTTDGLAGDSESKQTKSKSYLLPRPLVWPGQDLRWDFTTHVIQSRKSLPGLGFSWLHTQSKEMDAPRSSGVPSLSADGGADAHFFPLSPRLLSAGHISPGVLGPYWQCAF